MIRKVFKHLAGGKDISVQLMELHQGSEVAADYAIRFRTLAAQSGWNNTALWAVFHTGLNPALQTELACHMEATSLSQFVATAIRLDNLRHQHRAGTSASAAAHPCMRMDYPGRGERDPVRMQLGRSSLAEQERRPRGQMMRCYNCGSSGHLSALINSGVAVNLIDGALVEELGVPTSPCVPSLRITAIEKLACWSPTCLRECLRDPVSRPCRTSCIEEANPVAHRHLPKPYADFREVFSEERAARLPAHQAWDCAIDLLPNTSLPKGRIYPLSLPESKAMEDYIEGALAAGHIRPSTSSRGVLLRLQKGWGPTPVH
ncbi:hypothetical protein QTP70_015889 [Hemibagrus guttatus]|uniref:Retrotransposon gag domain-containing protein n=1 Tax=Hemibagrus guttatus TaxID=175788 RepID=A0AAE0Q5U6_9TELE|nr:hypothetical protein QTP70_015889 [Hemibagrus guttatus]